MNWPDERKLLKFQTRQELFWFAAAIGFALGGALTSLSPIGILGAIIAAIYLVMAHRRNKPIPTAGEPQ
jgi:hypothetical protein